MTDTTPPALVVSCAAYAVTQVKGQAPTALDEFEGTATFVAQGPTGEHHVCGKGGNAHDGTVRFYEKDTAAPARTCGCGPCPSRPRVGSSPCVDLREPSLALVPEHVGQTSWHRSRVTPSTAR